MQPNNQPQSDKPTNGQEAVKNAFESLRFFMVNLFDVRSETDKQETIESIKKDLTFKGHNAWILIFSIFIASIGLNVSSTAVVIGAMLISPLMGPIVGLGMSIAVNDIDTLRKSLINLGVMVGLSVLTAFLYFKLSPLTELTPELEARTYPTILDVLIAIFGGLALIFARTKKGTMASVIFGVAIATALMPPLCTAGYGFAVWEPKYFGGALYLFTINAIFIALTTFLVAKLLKFPMVKYANSVRRKRIAQLASLVAFLVIIPSVYLFYMMLKETVFKQNVRTFIQEEVLSSSTSFNLIKDLTEIQYQYNGDSQIDLYFMGSQQISNDLIELWKSKLSSNSTTAKTKLVIHQNEVSDSFNELAYMKQLRERDVADLKNKDEKIAFLESEVSKLSGLSKQLIPFEEVSKELKINYEDVETLNFANRISTNFQKTDTIPVFEIKWKPTVKPEEKIKNLVKIQSWLKFKLQKDTLLVRSLD